MKPTVLFLAGALMVASASTAAAQSSGERAERKTYTVPCEWKGDSKVIVKRYRECLASENQGVVEAALAHVIWIQVAAPCIDVAPLKADIDRLSVEGTPAPTRLRAYLASMVFENPEGFKALAKQEFQGPADLFAAVTGSMYAADSAEDRAAIAVRQ